MFPPPSVKGGYILRSLPLINRERERERERDSCGLYHGGIGSWIGVYHTGGRCCQVPKTLFLVFFKCPGRAGSAGRQFLRVSPPEQTSG